MQKLLPREARGDCVTTQDFPYELDCHHGLRHADILRPAGAWMRRDGGNVPHLDQVLQHANEFVIAGWLFGVSKPVIAELAAILVLVCPLVFVPTACLVVCLLE